MTNKEQEFHNHIMVAINFHRNGDLENAEKEYIKLLDVYPENATIPANLGTLYYQIQEYDAALVNINDALRLDPTHSAAYNTQGSIYIALNNLKDAEQSLRNAIEVNSEYKEAYYNLGNVLDKLGKQEEAINNYKIALQFNPNYIDAHYNLGNVLRDIGSLEDAVESYKNAISINDMYFEAHYNLGNVLHRLYKFDEAIVEYERAMQIEPKFAHSYINCANVLHESGNYEKSLIYNRQAMLLDPDNPATHYNRGITLHLLGKYQDAVSCYDTALALDHTLEKAIWNKSLVNLTLGHYNWGPYELRHNIFSKEYFNNQYVKWNGIRSLKQKTILICDEQGFGDFIQFCRYIPLIEKLDAKVIVKTPITLSSLISNMSKNISVITDNDTIPSFDYYCPITSLPLAFKTTINTIPNNTPYLFADKAKTKAWAKKLGKKTKPRIGLVWSGGFRKDQPETWSTNKRRNIPLELLSPFNKFDVEFISLQIGEDAEQELIDLQKAFWNGPIIKDYTNDIKDFSDTAALIENLDLVIAVDTSIVHLAGALGKEVWIMNRFDTCWRWLLDRSDSPWYPTAKIFRQASLGDWSSVVNEITNELSSKYKLKKPSSIKISGSKKKQMYNEAKMVHEGNDFENALVLYKNLFELFPTDADVLSNIGTVTYQLGDVNSAIKIILSSLKLNPNQAATYSNLGNMYNELNKTTEAINSYEMAIQIDKNCLDAYYNYGNLLYKIKEFDSAIDKFTYVIDNNTSFIAAYYNRGMAYHELAMYRDCITDCENAILLDPSFPRFYFSIGNAYSELHEYETAITYFDKAIELDTNYLDAYLNRGNTYSYLNDIESAARNYESILKIDESYKDAYSNYGNMLFYLNRLDDAIASHSRALELYPDFIGALWNKSYPLLAKGDYEEGWKLYEYRNQTVCKYNVKNYAQPVWDGKFSLDGKTILLLPEQGMGDFLQNIRYVSLLEKMGATVLTSPPTPLLDIISTVSKNVIVVSNDTNLPHFDCYCPIMSLPLLFNTSVDTIPNNIPYLFADKAKTKAWAKKLGKKTKPRIGLVWSGGFRKDQPETWPINKRRNIPLHLLEQFNEVDVDFISLQIGEDAEQELSDLIEDNWNGPKIRNYVVDIKDFSDTAALIENLDLVIAVDTSTVHLAGALGKEVWIMNRFDTCWRWLLDRTDSPWYPTARLFRQPALGDWKPVISEIVKALKIKFL